MKLACARCGAEFSPDQSAAACGHCAQHSGCGRVRCPYCGHEQAPAPASIPSLLTRLQRRFNRNKNR